MIHRADAPGFLTRFLGSRRGNVAMIFALALPVLTVIVGFGIDLSRQQAARVTAQGAVDAAILAAASSGVEDLDDLQNVVEAYLGGNAEPGTQSVNLDYTVTVTQLNETQMQVDLSGEVDALFGGLFGMSQMPINVSAVAERGASDGIELVMVLDNTWSMSASAGGATRIAALKTSAQILVDALMTEDAEDVRFGIVPYSEYVNVGMGNRGASWLDVAADYSTVYTPPPRVCQDYPVYWWTCTGGVWGTCTRYVDGVSETYGCWTTPQTCTSVLAEPAQTYQSCWGGGPPVTTHYRWYGCVYSRNTGNLRLKDNNAAAKYRGILDTSQTCLNPILPLTDQKTTVENAIDALVVNIGSYRPLTHIPSGLIWGVNVLSQREPFTEGDAYSEGNRAPRKIMVLMTDGENTLRYRQSDGAHVALSNDAATAANQKAATDQDTADLCQYAKEQGIEIYTVALSVTSPTALSMLQACASATNHFFDASDSASLQQAFSDIAASINAVRLVE